MCRAFVLVGVLLFCFSPSLRARAYPDRCCRARHVVCRPALHDGERKINPLHGMLLLCSFWPRWLETPSAGAVYVKDREKGKTGTLRSTIVSAACTHRFTSGCCVGNHRGCLRCVDLAAGPSFAPCVGGRVRVVVDPRGRARQPWDGASCRRGRWAVWARHLPRKHPRSGVGGEFFIGRFSRVGARVKMREGASL